MNRRRWKKNKAEAAVIRARHESMTLLVYSLMQLGAITHPMLKWEDMNRYAALKFKPISK